MAQQVEHVLGKDEVTGSSPVSSSIRHRALRCLFLRRFKSVQLHFRRALRCLFYVITFALYFKKKNRQQAVLSFCEE